MSEAPFPYTISEITDPEEIAAARLREEQFLRNVAWLEAHASEVYSHRGKIICISGQELFVGDTVEEVLARATAAHPDDDGRFTQIIPTLPRPHLPVSNRPKAT